MWRLSEDLRSSAKLMTKRNLDLVYRNSVPFTRQIISILKALGHEYQDGVDRLLGALLD